MLTDCVNRHDVRMIEASRETGFLQEPEKRRPIPHEVGLDDFERLFDPAGYRAGRPRPYLRGPAADSLGSVSPGCQAQQAGALVTCGRDTGSMTSRGFRPLGKEWVIFQYEPARRNLECD